MDAESSHRRLWSIDPQVTFLNHGSFGACPIEVLEIQSRLRAQLEREPVRFFLRELEPMVDAARTEIASFLGASPEDLVFVPNATSGVNTVLRSLHLAPGDELLTTDHAYNACRNALVYVAERTGARVVVANVPFPITGPEAIVDAVIQAVTPRTKLALLDHVTSQSAIVFPVDRLVRELEARGVDVLVDAAHAPAMVPVTLDHTGAAYTTGNFHKWVCAPKGVAFLHVRRDKQAAIRPLTVSHGANSRRVDRSRYLIEGDWTGTSDPTALLSVPHAIRFLGGLIPGGIPALLDRQHASAVEARRMICDALGLPAPCPDEMLGAMASIFLPGTPQPVNSIAEIDAVQETLFQRFNIEVPVFPFGWPARQLIRISTPIYVSKGDIEALIRALTDLGMAQKS